MLDGLEESDGGKVRIVEDSLQRMHRHHRDILALQQFAPFRGGTAEEDAADLLVDFVDMLMPRRMVGEARLLQEFRLADGGKETAPLLVIVDQRADVAIAGLVGTAVARQQPRIPAMIQWRIVGQA